MTRFRCALIGADTLLVECGRLLLERGHEIVSVAAGSDKVAAWALEGGIPTFNLDNLDNWEDELRRESVDYIFAITHLRLLSPTLVATANKMAINFHDGPLPEYAGLNTPVWGILRGETEWGVAWHRIDEGIDTGPILVQRRFAIAERETSLSLNTRNFERALDSFAELLELLETDRAAAAPQDATVPREVFRCRDRPDGVLDFNRPAIEVDRVVRALHFGPHPNTIAAAVLWHPNTALVVGSSEIVETGSGAAPGTLLAVDGGLTIACSGNGIRLGDLRRLDGTSLSALDFLEATGARVGDVLPQLSDEQRQLLADFAVIGQRDEAATIEALTHLSEATFPWPLRERRTTPAPQATVTVPLGAPCSGNQIVDALATLLRRLTPVGGLDIALAHTPAPEFARSLICTESVLTLAAGVAQPVGAGWFRDLIARTPRVAGRSEFALGIGLPIGVRLSPDDAPLPDAIIIVQRAASNDTWELAYDVTVVDETDATEFARCLAVTVGSSSPTDVDLLSAEVRHRVIHQWNATDAPYESACIHDLIARQVAAIPLREAVVCGDQRLTYQALAERSNRLAAHLQQVGVGPDSLVGVSVERSVDLIVAVLAVLSAGGAYVPLDPAYPADRLRHMIADSGLRVIICNESRRGRLPLPIDGVDRTIVAVDSQIADSSVALTSTVQPHNLAYCIYTSGSSGTPKAVLVEHRNVANLFAAMDAVIARGDHETGRDDTGRDDTGRDDTWCAVTSLSFDISVLELLYTLARGIRIVLFVPDPHLTRATRKAMDFSLFYFSADESEQAHDAVDGKYRLLLDGARFADQHGFCAVWTPERHFHSFGGLYPNPAITAAAVAAITERVGIRAGSVVLPLHHPVEIAEAWSMVDNLSNGRVGVSFASGWQPNDFVLRPQNYARAKQQMYEGIQQVRLLWRGESVAFDGPNETTVDVATLPRPVQAELPIWITTAGNPDSFGAAGTAGTNVLTHLVGQSIDELADKIVVYRAARAAAGHNSAAGVVTLMLHTFVTDDAATVRSTVREPLRRYLSSSYELLRDHAWAFPTFRRTDGAPVEHPDELADDVMANLTGGDLDAVLDFAAERYYESSGLFGTPEEVVPIVERLHQIGVDEIACLIDFGIPDAIVMESLPHLARVRELAAVAEVDDTANHTSIAEVVRATETTQIQCTPSMARMFTLDPAMREALRSVDHLLVGGEALPDDLARELHSLVGGTVTNMYGPTETTVWSSAWTVQANTDWTPIGTPIANTQCYVLDSVGQPVPPGVVGELWIGGAGVARGYHQRPELTAAVFRSDPFRDGGRMYRTGDFARWRQTADGCALLEFRGRGDQQVKLRGHRIELGEIESELARITDVDECAAVVIERGGDHLDQQLVAFVVSSNPASFDAGAVCEKLRKRLPDAMVPNQVMLVAALPRTPNGKLDRRALPTSGTLSPTKATVVPATSELEHRILASWQLVLGNQQDEIGIDDNFFDAGGHSLLVVRLHRHLQEALGRAIALTDLYRFPTVRSFTASLAGSDKRAVTAAVESGMDRAARRRASSRSAS